MGFLDKIKHALNIGGLKVEIDLPSSALSSSGTLAGKLKLSCEREIEITELKVLLLEKVTSQVAGKSPQVKWHTLGKTMIGSPKRNTSPDFQFDYSIVKTGGDQLEDRGGALGALGKLGKMAANERKEFFVEARAKVAGSLGATAKMKMEVA